MGFSQAQNTPYEIDQYEFIQYKKNKIDFPGDSTAYNPLFKAFDRLILRGEGQVNVVHIGGSHIQAGILSGQMAKRLQNFYPGLKAGRGFVFPYRIAKTNNPHSYTVKYSGKWDNCKCTNYRNNCVLGLSGISVTTADPRSTIMITLRDIRYPKYDFNRVKVFHETDSSNYFVFLECEGKTIKPIEVNEKLGYSLFALPCYTDTLKLKLVQEDGFQDKFTLYGMNLETDDPGVYYHAIGVNGSTIPAFLRCVLFENHMKVIDPDWVIMTLGTNDAYTNNFKPEYYASNYEKLIAKIKKAAPNAAILLTVPNDSYLHRWRANRNTALARDAIYKVAKKHNCAVWNFYDIMGGLNSITLWYKAGLSAWDKIHFNGRGYILKGDLLFNAFLRAYDIYLQNTPRTSISQTTN